MSDDYLWDKSGPADPEVAALEKALGSFRHDEPWKEPTGQGFVDEARNVGASPPSASPRNVGASPPSASPRNVGASPPSGSPRVARNVVSDPPKSARNRASQGSKASRVSRRAVLWGGGGVFALAASILVWFNFGRTQTPAAFTSLQKPERVVAPVSKMAQNQACSSLVSGFPFHALSDVSWGGLLCDGAPVHSGHLPVGAWLTTSEETNAKLLIADIGTLTLRGGSRIRLVRTGASEHRLELEKGSFYALVDAPPKLFVVDTEAATAVDLGCEYEMSTNAKHQTLLRVMKGAVSMEGKGRSVLVPRKSMVVADPDKGVGTVMSTNVSETLHSLVDRFDAGEKDLLEEILKVTKLSDSVTLWSLLGSVPKASRAKVVEQFAKLGLVPRGVRRELLVEGQPQALSVLRESLDKVWFGSESVEKSP